MLHGAVDGRRDIAAVLMNDYIKVSVVGGAADSVRYGLKARGIQKSARILYRVEPCVERRLHRALAARLGLGDQQLVSVDADHIENQTIFLTLTYVKIGQEYRKLGGIAYYVHHAAPSIGVLGHSRLGEPPRSVIGEFKHINGIWYLRFAFLRA